jgi:hypothetical protein
MHRRPNHRPADVEHESGPEVGLFLELLHHPAIGAGRDLPIDVPQLVARLVRTMLCKLDGESLARRAMEAREEPIHDPASHHFDAAERGDGRRIQKVRSVCERRCHRSGS